MPGDCVSNNYKTGGAESTLQARLNVIWNGLRTHPVVARMSPRVERKYREDLGQLGYAIRYIIIH